ncbi:N-acetylmuramic acid 6-phosphate etherase [Defluviimonas aestuarii]|uniref:N-acetylmuramic acid 6-phosphate etherase n=1 Tax=Albidovulum aestuarii TaxID=1130726 RepID=UPI00249CCE66|nr:N-acetylmuramic acid 6-phosphate etherase [Defluviimonas aestuarii]MDI3337310.1 N-acetylmuramic acid 6-phosphate etherase [Defluviimonas aestuarii]
MPSAATERLHTAAKGLDVRPGCEVLDALLAAQISAVDSVRNALPDLEAGAEIMADAIRAGHRLVYAGAGSSSLMANADGIELPGTYGIPSNRILLLMAGGLPIDANMPGATEDDIHEAEKAAMAIRAGDAVIAVTASGSTPYAVAVAVAAKVKGAKIIAVANNPGAPIFGHADVAICLPTPPEVIAGSTRMGAGTAQKVALNLMSTLMGIRLGQVHDGMMVGLVADNAKLRARAQAMVMEIAGVDGDTAARALASADGAVKPAVLIAKGANPDEAANLLTSSDNNLRAALARAAETGVVSRTVQTNQGSE